MIARLKGLAKIDGAGRSAEFVRPAIVLGAVLVVSLGVALFGGGESSAATDSHDEVVAVDSDDGLGAEPTAEAEDASGDGHGAEATAEAEVEADDANGDGHAAEPTAEVEDASGDGHGAEPTAEAVGGGPVADEHEDEPTVTATPEATIEPTFNLGVTATPSPGDVRWTDFISGEFAVSFKYEVTPDGFGLAQERTPDDERVVMWTLTRQSDGSSSVGEGPRGISIEVYVPDPFPVDAAGWVRTSADSHFDAESGELLPAVVGGAQGVRYRWSGSDGAVSTVVQFDRKIWVFSSTSREVSVGAFDVLLDSVVFWK